MMIPSFVAVRFQKKCPSYVIVPRLPAFPKTVQERGVSNRNDYSFLSNKKRRPTLRFLIKLEMSFSISFCFAWSVDWISCRSCMMNLGEKKRARHVRICFLFFFSNTEQKASSCGVRTFSQLLARISHLPFHHPIAYM